MTQAELKHNSLHPTQEQTYMTLSHQGSASTKARNRPSVNLRKSILDSTALFGKNQFCSQPRSTHAAESQMRKSTNQILRSEYGLDLRQQKLGEIETLTTYDGAARDMPMTQTNAALSRGQNRGTKSLAMPTSPARTLQTSAVKCAKRHGGKNIFRDIKTMTMQQIAYRLVKQMKPGSRLTNGDLPVLSVAQIEKAVRLKLGSARLRSSKTQHGSKFGSVAAPGSDANGPLSSKTKNSVSI